MSDARPGWGGQPHPAIVIAETAIKLGAVLVSDDAKLRQVVVEFGGAAVPSAHLA